MQKWLTNNLLIAFIVASHVVKAKSIFPNMEVTNINRKKQLIKILLQD